MKRILKYISGLVLMLAVLTGVSCEAKASSLNGNPNITWAPDGKAFTTDAGQRWYAVYRQGYAVDTGVRSSLRPLSVGEHYYLSMRGGEIPIGKWTATYSPGRCIHEGASLEEGAYYHGIDYRLHCCRGSYKTGWIGTCADCGGKIDILFYMNEETAAGIKSLPADKDYYYLCPLCKNLEQGREIKHECKAVSWNKYFVVYDKNSLKATGYMPNSTFMYNNADVYEGEPITPETKLKKCSYEREGYEFTGWNTERDGNGKGFVEQEKIYNLTSENNRQVVLYAQWEKSESTLHIDPAGGSFRGKTGITSVTQGYGSILYIAGNEVTPPVGNRVQFMTDGGSMVEDIYTVKQFLEWKQSVPFHGELKGEEYIFRGRTGAEDTLTAVYGSLPITLPSCSKTGMSFGGWYRDAGCTDPAGAAGDQVVITEDTVLYAKWVELKLTAFDNYSVFGGSGGVDLFWTQPDGIRKTYGLYQSRDRISWQRLSFFQNPGESIAVSESFTATKSEKTYTVPYSGMYTLTVTGAQGQSWGSHAGGKGGRISASVWLPKGEVLTYSIGTSDGYNGGGKGSDYGTGGGMTKISGGSKGTLLIAGGGGGASSQYDGGDGGSSRSVLGTEQGGSGGTGGGGGYRGGTGGDVVRHYHTGSSQTGGGCYTKAIAHTHTAACYTDKDFWRAIGNSGVQTDACGCTHTTHDWWCPKCDARATSRTNSSAGCTQGHHLTDDYRKDNHTHPDLTCTKTNDGYALACPYAKQPNGAVVSAKQAFGGSNYVNTACCSLKVDQAGIGTGDGSIQLVLTAAEYIDDEKLSGVAARDLAAPDAVDAGTLVKTAVGENEVRIMWNPPEDHGTVYFHQAASYNAVSGTKLCDSNITANTLTSGIGGYYFCVDGAGDTVAGAENGAFQTANSVTLTMTEDVQYLHLAAADVAGNVSDTTHILIGRQDADVAWKLHTEQIQVNSYGDNLYAAPGEEKSWYVRADGETPFTLAFTGSMEHQALFTYQINHLLFDSTVIGSGENQRYDIETKSHAVTEGEIVTEAGELEKSMSGMPVLTDAAYTVTTRKNQCRDLSIVQSFTLPPAFDTEKIAVVPVAGADHGKETAYSAWSEDVLHGICLIGDASAPEVQGTELLEHLQEGVIDQDDGQVLLDLTCTDTGSGVREFYVTVLNLDNLIEKDFRADSDGHIRMDLTDRDDFVLNGDFMVTVHAIDNVGNDAELTYATCEFFLSAWITRMREPHDPIFKLGETGILHITATGYVDGLEIMPVETLLPAGEVFYYENPDFLQQEELEFFIPLDAPEQSYTFVVRAYKNGQSLEEHPKMAVMEVSGRVVDEFRRKILWYY